MRIADIMALVVPPVTDQLRRTRARQEGRAAQPMFPTIIAVRNERVVAAVSTPRLQATLSCALSLGVGVGAEALVVAAEVTVDGGQQALSYTVMTRDRRAKWVIQEVHAEQVRQLGLTAPADAGEPEDRTVLESLAEAMSQSPLDPATVNRTDHKGTFGNAPFLPPEQGRVVLDAGTVRTLQERVQGIAGQALYLPRSPEAGRLARSAGLPRRCLVVGDPTLTAPDTGAPEDHSQALHDQDSDEGRTG